MFFETSEVLTYLRKACLVALKCMSYICLVYFTIVRPFSTSFPNWAAINVKRCAKNYVKFSAHNFSGETC